MIATKIRDIEDWTGQASVYKLSKPITYEVYNEEYEVEKHKTSFVIVSATIAPFTGPETYAFPHDGGEGNDPLSWTELSGSRRGIMNHGAVLRNLGATSIREGVKNEYS